MNSSQLSVIQISALGANADAALGIATLARYRIQRIGLIQISLILVYSILISMGPSELWLHPFGPVTKNIPLMVI